MGLDIRIPLGLMFLITGGLMAIYGLFTHGSAIYALSLGINLNLLWGTPMFLFGLLTLPARSAFCRMDLVERWQSRGEEHMFALDRDFGIAIFKKVPP